MPTQLGTLEELSQEYRDQLTTQAAMPLWPAMRDILPYGQPIRRTLPHLWRYRELRPLLLQAGELTPIEKAERRVLMLANPGLEGAPFATASIFFGLQLILPGEVAPNHKHSIAAVRLIVEGEGGFTTIGNDRCPMEKGDVILTPANRWHQHEHHGEKPMIWLDALDAPVVVGMEANYCIEGEYRVPPNRLDASQTHFRRAGVIPYESLDKDVSDDFPLLRFPWSEIRVALEDLARASGPNEPVRLAYVNPETGQECMKTLGFTALMLRPGEELRPPRRSACNGYLVVEGTGKTEVDGTSLAWEDNDVFVAPTHAVIRHRNASSSEPAFLIRVDDAPIQRKLGIYEEFPDDAGS